MNAFYIILHFTLFIIRFQYSVLNPIPARSAGAAHPGDIISLCPLSLPLPAHAAAPLCGGHWPLGRTVTSSIGRTGGTWAQLGFGCLQLENLIGHNN